MASRVAQLMVGSAIHAVRAIILHDAVGQKRGRSKLLDIIRGTQHKVEVSEGTDGSDEEYVFVVSPARTQTKLSVLQAHVKIHKCTIPVMIDSGAHVSILDETL